MRSRNWLLITVATLCLFSVAVLAGDIHEAAKEGDASAVKKLIRKNPSAVKEPDEVQNTPLHLASMGGHLKVVKILLANGADLEAGDREASTPLHVAAQKGQDKVVRHLLSQGAQVNGKDDNGMTALHFASYEGHIATVEMLLAKGAAISLRTKKGSTPLHGAAYGGHKEVAELLISKGMDAAIENEYGWAPLMSASYAGHLDLVVLLVSKGAAKNRTHLDAALNHAIRAGNAEIVELFLETGASADEANEHGMTPLHNAALYGRKDLAVMLIARGADINADGWGGRTPLAAAADRGHHDVAGLLLAKGASGNVQDEEGTCLLHRLVAKGDVEMVRLLLENDAKPDLTDTHYGMTSLHWAALTGNREVIGLLVVNGAHIDAEDLSGKTPIFYAAKYGHKDVAKLLKAKGASPCKLVKNFEKSPLLGKELQEKEAALWYLGHCGWAVKTANHLLVFDYYRQDKKPAYPGLANGHLNPEEIAGENLTVFVTHDHHDHFDPEIFALTGHVPDISYVYGFRPARMPQEERTEDPPVAYSGPEYVHIGPHEKKVHEGMKVRTIESNDAGVGFVVQVDGITLYHAGDHAGWRDGAREGFTKEIDYLAERVDEIDLAFLNVTGCHAGDPKALFEGNLYTLNKLSPKVWFPTHAMGREHRYKEAADKFAGENLKSQIAYPEHSGDCFVYESGAIRSCDGQGTFVAALAPSKKTEY